jgi:hypothetical protein
MKLNDLKRIKTEDFATDDRELVSKLAYLLNPFLEQINTLLNHNVDFDNLNQEVITLTVELKTGGVPKVLTEFKSSLKTRIKGLICISAANLENDGTFPTTAPFISYSIVGDLIRIQNITGLPVGKRYTLTIISIG